ARDRHWLNADARVEPDLLLASLEHFLVEKINQAGTFRRALLPLDAGVNVFRVFAEDDDVHAFGMTNRRRSSFVILDGANTGVKIQNLPEGDIERANTPPTGVVSGPLMATRYSRIASTVSSGSQVLNWAIDFS